jgi:hypothetical protein
MGNESVVGAVDFVDHNLIDPKVRYHEELVARIHADPVRMRRFLSRWIGPLTRVLLQITSRLNLALVVDRKHGHRSTAVLGSKQVSTLSIHGQVGCATIRNGLCVDQLERRSFADFPGRDPRASTLRQVANRIENRQRRVLSQETRGTDFSGQRGLR